MKKFKNMNTPFWNVITALVMIGTGLITILTLGFFHPDWHISFLGWKLRQMFIVVNE